MLKNIAPMGLLLAASLTHAAPTELAGFPAHAEGKNSSTGILVVDLDLDKQLEIVVASGDGIAVLRHDGTLFPGFPISLSAEGMKVRMVVETVPVACDLDGDGRPEIVLTSSNKRLWAVSAGGALMPGFPVSLEGRPRGPLACIGDRKKELAFTTDDGELVRVADGKIQVIARIGRGAESGVGVADLDGDGVLDFAVGGGDSKLYVVDYEGRVKKGFPYKMSFRVSGIPAIGDINDDGRADIVFGSQDFKIHAVSLTGEVLPGFPVATGYRVYAGAALADLTGDGVLDIVVGSGDSKLYALTGAGEAVKGFPIALDGRVVADAAIGDVDRDGKQEIAVVTQAGSLYLFTAAGKKVAGFPFRLGGKVEIAPAVADLNGDGLPEVIAQATAGAVHVFTFAARGEVEEARVAWAMLGHDAAHSGRFGPNAGRFKDLSFVNPEPKTADEVAVQYRFFDLDGEDEKGTKIRWYLNGRYQQDLDDLAKLPVARTRKHQRWLYTVQEGDNFSRFGFDGRLTRTYSSPEVQVLNTAPAAPGIDLSPKDARTTADLVAAVTAPSIDPDGDEIEYRFIWITDHKVQQELRRTTARIRSTQTKKKEQWRLVVVPFDGEVEGESNTAVVIVDNTPPTAPKIVVQPAAPRVEDLVKIEIVEPAKDDDGDVVAYEYRYWVDGQLLNLPLTSSVIPARVLRKHQSVKVVVTAVDDQQAGGTHDSTFVVLNTIPPPPALAIWPPGPRTADGIAFGFTGQQPDADGDPINYSHQWTVDGALQKLPMVVAKEATRKGQKWRLEVVPSDGEAQGPPAIAEAVIQNTPPEPPLAIIDNSAPGTDQAVAPRIVMPATDVDGDALVLKYRWSKNGKATKVPETQAALPAAETKKGEHWTVTIAANDGAADGAGARLGVTVRNSPPSAPVPRAEKAAVTTRERLSVGVATPGHDKDGDPLAYHYRWLRGGVVAKKFPATQSSLEPGECKRGEQWAVEVRAFDGEEEGPAASVSFRITNHPPEPPRVTLAPAQPGAGDTLTCNVQGNGDPDNDQLSFLIQWFADVQPVSLPLDAGSVPSSLTHKEQEWTCEGRAFDGELASKPARSKPVTIRNSPPSAPRIALTPAMPTAEVELVCSLEQLATDVDRDRISYRYIWRVNGKVYDGQGGDGPGRLPAAATKRAEKWECEVIPSDDDGDGVPARASVTINNSPPTTPVVKVTPRRPRAGEALACEVVEESRDADGDPVTYRYQWMRDGTLQRLAAKQLATGSTGADDLWRCKVTPTDGKTDGEPGLSPDVVIRK